MPKVNTKNSQRKLLFRLVESKFYRSNEEIDTQTKKVLWENITRILNNIGPPKSCAKWRKYWTDVLLRVRKKIILRNTVEGRGLKRAEYAKEDLEILRITGGEEKLLSDFRPRNFTKITNKGIPTYYINDSSPEFDITNQPVADDYCEMEQIQSGNSYDHTMDDDSIQVETNSELNERKIQSTKTTHNEQKTNSHRPNTNIPKSSNQNSNKRRNISHQFDSSSNSSSSSSNSHFLPMIEQQQNDEEYVTNFDINEDNASYNLNNCTEKINFAPLMPIKQNQETAKSKRQPQQQKQQQQQHQLQLQQHQQQQQQQQFLPNQFGYYNEELLNVQKETLMEIRKVNERQQETNQLLKILIEKLGNSADASTNKHNEEAELKQISKNILCETYFKDASEIVIKNEW